MEQNSLFFIPESQNLIIDSETFFPYKVRIPNYKFLILGTEILGMRSTSTQQDIDDKIVQAFERISSALRILLWDLAKEEGLSPLQIQFLLYLSSHSADFCTVSNLAKEFGLTRATVSDTIKVLLEKGLVIKKSHEKDGRIFTLRLTKEGKRQTKKLDHWMNVIKENLKHFPPQIKETVIIFLMEFIRSLQKAGIIKVARMCISCRHFQKNVHPDKEKPHHCILTDTPIGVKDIKIDCFRHESILVEIKD